MWYFQSSLASKGILTTFEQHLYVSYHLIIFPEKIPVLLPVEQNLLVRLSPFSFTT